MPNSYSCWTPAFGLPSTLSASYYAWGLNIYGQFGDGTNGNISNVPVPVFVRINITQVAAGYLHSLTLTSDGKVYAWGYNQGVQLGNGTTTNSNAPILVTGLLAGTKIKQVAAGGFHSLALAADGKVYAWGFNTYGQLGNGANTNSSVPITVITTGVLTGKTITQVDAGGYHSLALTADGTVYAWGYNTYGRLGDGTTTDRNTPVAVIGLDGKTITQVAAGGYSLALTADGTVYAWGYNVFGQLGDGTTTDRNTPVAVIGLDGKTITQVAAGDFHSLALTADGTVYAWGANTDGRLGDGTNTNSKVPVAVIGLDGKTITQVAAGGGYSFALTADGKVYAWGFNQYGQLGNGANVNSNVPIPVKDLRRIKQVAAGFYHSLAL